MNNTDTHGFLYVATGKRFVTEAMRSVQSLRRTNPGTRVCLMTDCVPPTGLFDDVIVLAESAYGFADKLRMAESPYARTVFLDADTLIVGDIRGLFRLLDAHDLAAKPEVYPGWDYEFPDVPPEFIEYNTGVIAFRRAPAVTAFFTDWAAEYHALRATSARFDTDQPSFRRAVYRSAVRHCSIPPEYHLQADMGGYLFWDARVIHCHDNPEAAAGLANRIRGPRAYLPQLTVVPAGYSGLRSHLATWARLNWDFAVALWSHASGRFTRRPPPFGRKP